MEVGLVESFQAQVLQVQGIPGICKVSKAASIEVEPSATITTPHCMTSKSPKAPLFRGIRTAPKADSVKAKGLWLLLQQCLNIPRHPIPEKVMQSPEIKRV